MEWYPKSLRVDSHGSQSTIDFLVRNFERNSLFHYAEFGIYEGSTAKAIASHFPNAILHLFDFHNVLDQFSSKHPEFENRIQFYGNTQKYNDSYNWNLSKLLHQGDIRFDYIFLDGAHTFAVDALTFFLSDRLIMEGGYIEFDDYEWRLRGSSLDPGLVPEILTQYTDEQIDDYQVKRIVDLLVKKDSTYVEILTDRTYQKKSLGRGQSISLESTNSPTEIAFISDAMAQSERYLEFGSGFSTLLALNYVKSKIVSVETSLSYVSFIKTESRLMERYSDVELEFVYVNIGECVNWGMPTDESKKSSWPKYSSIPLDLRAQSDWIPDLILIDGRFRVATFLMSLLNFPGALILFDDYEDRDHYHVVEEIVPPTSTCGRVFAFQIPLNISAEIEEKVNQLIKLYEYDPR